MAAGGEIRWPRVGRTNGRLRGESHGRGHFGPVSHAGPGYPSPLSLSARKPRAPCSGYMGLPVHMLESHGHHFPIGPPGRTCSRVVKRE